MTVTDLLLYLLWVLIATGALTWAFVVFVVLLGGVRALVHLVRRSPAHLAEEDVTHA